MTITEMGTRLDVSTCTGGCGLSVTRHREGAVFMGIVHFADRRFTRRAAKNYLMLVARRDREADAGYLNNIELYDWFYTYLDAVNATRMAKTLGFRLPAAIFNRERSLCQILAANRGVRLSKYKKVWNWAHG